MHNDCIVLVGDPEDKKTNQPSRQYQEYCFGQVFLPFMFLYRVQSLLFKLKKSFIYVGLKCGKHLY